jgi:hypothetical protein
VVVDAALLHPVVAQVVPQKAESFRSRAWAVNWSFPGRISKEENREVDWVMIPDVAEL